MFALLKKLWYLIVGVFSKKPENIDRLEGRIDEKKKKIAELDREMAVDIRNVDDAIKELKK